MDAKELRSGNYLQGTPIDIPRLGIHSDGITRITAHGIAMIEEGHNIGLEPIQITGELLLKCKQIEHLYGDCYGIFPSDYEKGDDHYCIQKHSGYWLIYIYSPAGDFDAPLTGINELHILQNIFLDLTGEELTFK